MMKKYKIRGFSALMDVEMNTDDAKLASTMFETMENSNSYTCGYVVDNYTGEMYCNFEKS